MTRRPSIDGFIPRRPVGDAQNIGLVQENGLTRNSLESPIQPSKTLDGHGLERTPRDQATASMGLSRSDIDESLNSIDTQDPTPQDKRKKTKGNKSKARRIIKWIFIVILVAVLGVGGWLASKTLNAGGSVFKGNILGLIQQQKLKEDSKGRTNILVLGTSEDDPGHPGGYLTDSILLLSVDQKNHNAYMISVPRDLEVKYGMACNSGYAGKINEYFNCVNQDYTSTQAEDDRQSQTRAFIGGVLGVDIQYSVHVNYSVMRDVVGALGTITVNIQGSGGAPGVMDSNFDWKCKGGNAYASLATMKKNCPPNGHYIDYPNGPTVLDAEHALYLAQARGDVMPTYGLGNSNFDREQNQQKIVLAIKDKALSSGTLTNIGKVSGLIDAIGNNLRTNFDTSEIGTLVSLAKEIPSSSITSYNLLNDGIMDAAGQPVAGKYNFTQFQAYVQKKLYATGITKEDAHVMVLNGSGVAGVAQTEANKLTALGVTIDAVDNAPNATYTNNIIYQVTPNAKPDTAAKLQQLYGVKPQVVTAIPGVTLGDNTDYVVIVVNASATGSGSTSAGQ